MSLLIWRDRETRQRYRGIVLAGVHPTLAAADRVRQARYYVVWRVKERVRLGSQRGAYFVIRVRDDYPPERRCLYVHRRWWAKHMYDPVLPEAPARPILRNPRKRNLFYDSLVLRHPLQVRRRLHHIKMRKPYSLTAKG